MNEKRLGSGVGRACLWQKEVCSLTLNSSSYFSCLQKSLLEEALHYISEHKSLDNRILDDGVPDSNYMSFYLCMIFCYELMFT